MGTYFFTAAREGFEPPEALTPQTLSRRPHSAALPPRQNRFEKRSKARLREKRTTAKLRFSAVGF